MNEQSSWKEKFDSRYPHDLYQITDSKIRPTVLNESIKEHISTEIIEKLIADIPDIDLVSVFDESARVNLKQQLRDKWL